MFKIVLSNTRDTIPVETIEEVRIILARIKAGDNVIICSNGVFNPSYFVGILYDAQAERNSSEAKRLGYKAESSPFAKLLSSKIKMLSD